MYKVLMAFQRKSEVSSDVLINYLPKTYSEYWKHLQMTQLNWKSLPVTKKQQQFSQ